MTDALVNNILTTHYEDIGPEVIENTRLRILDMIGNAIAGARCDGNEALAELGAEGRPEATLLGYGTKASISQAAFVNCVFGRSFDRGPLTYVVNGRRSPNHITETSVLTAVAVGESRKINGRELVASLVVGDDLAARLHLCVDRGQPGQSLPPGTPPPPQARGSEEAFAAAAITGRMLGLNAGKMKHALGLATILSGRAGGGVVMGGPTETPRRPPPAGARPAGTEAPRPAWQGVKDPSFIATMAAARTADTEKNVSVKLSNGISARNGVEAAELAKAGWPGVREPIFGENGGHFASTAGVHVDRVLEGLGRSYIVEVCFKPFPGGRPTGAPTMAALAIATKHNIDTDAIQDIVLHLSPVATAAHYATPYTIGDYPPMNALWSYYYVVASALYRKSAAAENFTSARIKDPKLQALVAKVRLDHLDEPEGIELEVVMKDGARFSEYVRTALGDPSNPVSREQLVDKFMEQVEFSRLVPKTKARRIIELVINLEQVEDVGVIARLAGRSSK